MLKAAIPSAVALLLLACGASTAPSSIGEPSVVVSHFHYNDRDQREVPMATPAPAPSPSPAAEQVPVTVPDMIRTAFAPLGLGAVNWALAVAYCESGYNPSAYNSSGASGVFQFLPSTWAMTPYAGASPFNAWANVQAGAWLYAHDGGSPWLCSARV